MYFTQKIYFTKKITKRFLIMFYDLEDLKTFKSDLRLIYPTTIKMII